MSRYSRLKGVWQVRLNGSGFGPRYSAEAQPIFFNGVLYVATPANDVFAIDDDSGNFLWTYEPLYYDGLVITGFAGAEFGARGRVKAYAADDGSLLSRRPR